MRRSQMEENKVAVAGPAKVRKLKIPVMEMFGPTIQGEGMVVGRKTMFVRTGGCDYGCSWCDSAFTWDGSQKATMTTPQDIWDELVRIGSTEVVEAHFADNMGAFAGQPILKQVRNFDHVTVSGGNPALIGKAMEEFIDICTANGVDVGLETQGSRWQEWFYKISDLTISPKPPSSKMETNWETLDFIIDKLNAAGTNYTLKVVVFNEEDFAYAKKVDQRYKQKVFYVSVGNEDAYEPGDISGRLLRELDGLWDRVMQDPEANHWRPLPQLHTLVWANKRGV